MRIKKAFDSETYKKIIRKSVQEANADQRNLMATNKKEQLRLKLIEWIAELVTEWKFRPYGAGNSDLIIKLTNRIDKFYGNK